jgi:hypothetical protein
MVIWRDALSAMDQPPAPQTSRLAACADDFARREPTKAVISAFGAGVLLNMLPLGAIVSALVAVAFSLVRPALLFLGLLKACELCGIKPPLPSQHD